jgi:uncharacterized protein (TIGR00369 family)
MQEIINQILKNDPFLAGFGGGAIMSLLDTAGGLSIVTRGNLVNQVTLNLNTDFMRPVSSGPVTITGKVTREGKSIVFCEMEIRDGQDTLCARGTGSWFVFR